MEYVRLGRSGLKVSRVCVGTNMFGAGYVEDDRAISVIDAAYDAGINFVDTADAYNSGHSEVVVGRAVRSHRHDFVVATKGFIATGPGPNDVGLSRKHLMDAVEGSLRRLGTDYIDLYQVHYFDPDTPLEESLRTLDDMVRQGKIRYIGCSNFAAWQLVRALWVSDKNDLERFESVQPEYNLGKRTSRGSCSMPALTREWGSSRTRYSWAECSPGDTRRTPCRRGTVTWRRATLRGRRIRTGTSELSGW